MEFEARPVFLRRDDRVIKNIFYMVFTQLLKIMLNLHP